MRKREKNIRQAHRGERLIRLQMHKILLTQKPSGKMCGLVSVFDFFFHNYLEKKSRFSLS